MNDNDMSANQSEMPSATTTTAETAKRAARSASKQRAAKASARQVAANRANAAKSTGPRTVEGRAAAARNAVRHGIFSMDALVWDHESTADLTSLQDRFAEHYRPAGPVEEMLVGQIVSLHWRLRRVLRAEAGEIALSVDQGEWSRRHGTELQAEWHNETTTGDPIGKMAESARGTEALISWVEHVRSMVEAQGELTDVAVAWLEEQSAGPNRLTQELKELAGKLERNPEKLKVAELRARNLRESLAFVDEKLRWLEARRAQCRAREARAELAWQAAATVPAAAVVDKLGRYEARLHRQLFKAMKELREVQGPRSKVQSPEGSREEREGSEGKERGNSVGRSEHSTLNAQRSTPKDREEASNSQRSTPNQEDGDKLKLELQHKNAKRSQSSGKDDAAGSCEAKDKAESDAAGGEETSRVE